MRFEAKLRMNYKLVQSYQNTDLSSRESKLRLLEMVATSLHKAAASIYHNTDEGPDANTTDPDSGQTIPYPWSLTRLLHLEYKDHDQYPLGVADMAGYWAELQVFGGVVLFDRGEPEHGVGTQNAHLSTPPFPEDEIPLVETLVADMNATESGPRCLHPPRHPVDDIPALRRPARFTDQLCSLRRTITTAPTFSGREIRTTN